jgi:predicted glycosyltransferase
VLGLRDIVDAPDVVRRDWTRQGVYDALELLYDRILIYGVREVMDLVEAYALSPAVAAKVRYCGYVTDPPSTGNPPPEVSLTTTLPERFLLATGGGGGDGLPMLRTFLEALLLLPPTSALVLTGPLMNGRDRPEERVRPRVRLLDCADFTGSSLAGGGVDVLQHRGRDCGSPGKGGGRAPHVALRGA